VDQDSARWLATLSFAHASDQIAFTGTAEAREQRGRRVQRLTRRVEPGESAGWRFESVVRALQALRAL